MLRLASALAAVLALLAGRPARAEPYDLDLARLGPPDARVWAEPELLGTTTPEATRALAALGARQRFAVLSAEMALALSSAVLHPASTTGHSGFSVDLEAAAVAVHPDAVGQAPGFGFSTQPWATRGAAPTALYLPSVHVRKALPFSFEMGGRMIYLAESSYFAGQLEGKWALHEGFRHVPDLAVRAAYTRLFGQRDWNLSATDLDLVVSKRWGVKGVTSLTPYVAARLTFVSASSDRMDFAPAPGGIADPDREPADLVRTQAAFPHFSARLYRTTLGLRFTAYAVSLAAEATYFGGASPSDDDYEGVELEPSLGGAAKLGFEF